MQNFTTRTPLLPQSSKPFRYRPLNQADGEDFRLICLYPADFHEPIRCDLFHASLESGVEYEALSYTWASEDGDADLSTPIECAYLGEEDSAGLLVTTNCASALRRLRSSSQERVLWVDAIAIDQTNQQERSHQVELMARIYSGASQVLVYLGEEDLGFASRSLWLDSEKRQTALKKLFAKRWGSRVWVIQEVALAQKVVMVTGEVSCHMDANLMSRIRGRARVYGLQVPGPLAWDPLVSAPTRDLLTMLQISHNCLSTDPRDKVYGLLGLTGERVQSLITVDYSESVEELLTRTAAAIIICREDFEILAYASLWPNLDQMGTGLPSWAPDWTKHRGNVTLDPQFRTDKIGPWRSLNKLSGRLSHREPAEIDWEAAVSIPPNWASQESSKPYITVRAHCIAKIGSTTRVNAGSTRHWQKCQDFTVELKTFVNATAASGEVNPGVLPSKYRWLFDPKFARHRSESGSSVERRNMTFDRTELQRFCDELARFGHNQYIFRAGYLPAITSHDFAEGDTVWAVDGCTVPLILRHTGDPISGAVGAQHYKIVGNCRLFALSHLDCWTNSGTGVDQRWDFDPFRYMDALGTQVIRIY